MTFLVVVGTTLVVTLGMRPVYRAKAVLEIQRSGGEGLSLEGLFSETMMIKAERELTTEVEILQSQTIAMDATQIGRLQLVLDKGQRFYKKIFRRYADRFQGLFKGKEKPGKAVTVSRVDEPLSLEVLEVKPATESLSFRVVFSGDSRFRLQGMDGETIATGRLGHPCVTGLFAIRLDGDAPRKGTVFTLNLRPEIDAASDLQSRLKVTPIRNTRLVRLEMTAADPDSAMRDLSSVMTAYHEFKIKQKTQMISKTLEFIDQQLRNVDEEMQKAVDKLRRFKEENQLVNLSESVSAAIGQLAGLEKSQNELMIRHEQAQFLLTTLQSQYPVDRESFYALGNTMEQPLLITLASNLSSLQAERAALRSQYTAQHPIIKALDKKISELKEKLKAEIKSLIASLAAQKAALEREIRKTEGELKKIPGAEQHLADLMRQAKVFQDTYSFLLQKRGELQITRASQIGDIYVIEPPHARLGFIKPRMLQNLLLAIVVGLFLGTGLAFLFEYLDDSVKNPDDVQSLVKLPVLGVIGHHGQGHNSVPPHRERCLPVLDESRSQIAEAFRTFRSNLLFTSVDQPRRLMLFTSALPEEGKSTSLANLAIALTHLGKRVLMVDTDLRKPVLHRVFRCSRFPGLVNLLVQEEWEEHLAGAVRNVTGVPDLGLLPCGDVPPNPSELLGSEKMTHLMEALAQRYDFVLFDSSPLLSVSDAMILSQRTDGVVLVVRGGKTNRTALKNASDLLAKTRSEVLGVVLNDIDFKRERYYYYSQYYYQGYYSDSEDDPKASSKRRHLRKKLGRKPGHKSKRDSGQEPVRISRRR